MSTFTESTVAPPRSNDLAAQLRDSREFFERTTSVLTDEHSGFAPRDGMMTVTEQVAHVADTFDWFHEALLEMKGFDLDFEARLTRVAAVPDLAAARAMFDDSHRRLLAYVETTTPEALEVRLPEDDPILPGWSRSAILGAIIEHTAHHRGALSAYIRVAGLVPPMPYGESPG